MCNVTALFLRACARPQPLRHRRGIHRHSTMVVADNSHYYVRWDPGRQRYLLGSRLTGDSMELPQSRAKWELDTHTDGQAFVACEGCDPLWCMDALPHVVAQNEDGAYIVVDERGASMGLQEWKQHFQSYDVPVGIVGAKSSLTLVVFRLAHAWDGAIQFWSLKVVHSEIVGMSAQTPSQWYQNWWLWWHKRLSKFGVPETHLRRASEVGPPRACSGMVEDEWGVRLRVFPDACCSTVALIALWCRWAGATNAKKKDQFVAAAWRSSLQSFCEAFFREEPTLELVLFEDKLVDCTLGYPLVGKAPFELCVRFGTVAQVSTHKRSRLLTSVMDLMPWVNGGLALNEFLVALDRQGVESLWLLKQVVCRLAEFVDERCAAREAEQAGAAAGSSDDENADNAMALAEGPQPRARKRRLKLGKLALQVRRHVSDDMQVKLLQYYLAGRKVFSSARNFSLAVDASRVGQRPLMMGIAATPGNIGFWLPPQANRLPPSQTLVSGGAPSGKSGNRHALFSESLCVGGCAFLSDSAAFQTHKLFLRTTPTKSLCVGAPPKSADAPHDGHTNFSTNTGPFFRSPPPPPRILGHPRR